VSALRILRRAAATACVKRCIDCRPIVLLTTGA
jgi:hypothetical protein